MNDKLIALIDGNNFFASCEILMNPNLKNKPVCVLSNNDGCVVARSYEAKKLGIPMGIPFFMAKKQFPNATYLSANFSLYHELSQRMMDMLKNYSDKIDIYSIDEAFIDITGLCKILNLSKIELAKKIKNDIEENIGISVAVGIATSKVLAKLASHKAKKLNGIYVIEKEDILKELYKVPIEDIWGVGKNISKSLKKYGIFYANDILSKDDEFYKYNYGKKGLELKYELSGISVIPLTGIIEKPKSIQRTRAFPNFSGDKKYIMTELEMHLHNVCRKMREYNLQTSLVGVMLRTKDFRVFFTEKKLDNSTSAEIILIKYVKELFNQIYNNEVIYRSSGILAASLIDIDEKQCSLFSYTNNDKAKNLSNTLDKLEFKFGKGIISLGNSGIKEIQEKHKRK